MLKRKSDMLKTLDWMTGPVTNLTYKMKVKLSPKLAVGSRKGSARQVKVLGKEVGSCKNRCPDKLTA